MRKRRKQLLETGFADDAELLKEWFDLIRSLDAAFKTAVEAEAAEAESDAAREAQRKAWRKNAKTSSSEKAHGPGAVVRCDMCFEECKKFSWCGGCKAKRYCSGKCQKQDWSTGTDRHGGPHKAQCKLIAKVKALPKENDLLATVEKSGGWNVGASYVQEASHAALWAMTAYAIAGPESERRLPVALRVVEDDGGASAALATADHRAAEAAWDAKERESDDPRAREAWAYRAKAKPMVDAVSVNETPADSSEADKKQAELVRKTWAVAHPPLDGTKAGETIVRTEADVADENVEA